MSLKAHVCGIFFFWRWFFQNLKKGPHFIYCAFDWSTLDLVADPSVLSHVRARCSVVVLKSHPRLRFVSPSCKCCIWCILLVIILVLLRCIFIKQIFTDRFVLLFCYSDGLSLRIRGWRGWCERFQPAKEVQRAASHCKPSLLAKLYSHLQPLCGREPAAGDRKCQPWAGVQASHLACHWRLYYHFLLDLSSSRTPSW